MGFKLRDYQQDAVDFFKENKRVLFKMACSAGKTLTSICCIEKLPVLVITPSTVKYPFKADIEKFMGDKYTVEILSGREIKKLPPADIYIINPDILHANRFILRDKKFKLVVYDESHFFKNPKVKRQKSSVFIGKSVPHKIVMTATPITTAPIDYFGQLQVLYPEYFGGSRGCKMSWYDFARKYSDGHKNFFGHFECKKWTSPEIKKEFYERFKNVIFEVTEEQVMKDVPPCNVLDWHIELPKKYKKEHEKIQKDFEQWLKEQDLTPYEFFKKMNTKGLARAAELRKMMARIKADYTIKFIKENHPDKKVVLFTWYQESADILKEEYGDSAVTITGKDSTKKKEENRLAFINDPNVKYAIIQIKAGGVGINLQAGAYTAIYVSLPHNWSDFEQSYKRLWRTGQKNIVTIYKLLVDNTIDIDMNKVIYEKKKL